jgi:flavin reductase (DIM6/NTAB) family NADH-FMN oxidoreductase RutF
MKQPTEQQPVQSFAAEALAPLEVYKILAGSVVPRPIAWVSTVDAQGVRNLAPFSFFTVASANPPVVCFCPSVREPRDGLRATKDTAKPSGRHGWVRRKCRWSAGCARSSR